MHFLISIFTFCQQQNQIQELAHAIDGMAIALGLFHENIPSEDDDTWENELRIPKRFVQSYEKPEKTEESIVIDDDVSVEEISLSKEEDWIEAKRKRGWNRRQERKNNQDSDTSTAKSVRSNNKTEATSKDSDKDCKAGTKCPDTDVLHLYRTGKNNDR